MKPSTLLAASLFTLPLSLLADTLPELQPILGKRGRLIGSAEDFAPHSSLEKPLRGFGDYTVTDGVLRQQQKEGQDHNPILGLTAMLGLDAASDRAFMLKEGILQFDFRTDQADHMHVEFMRKAGRVLPGQPVPEKGGISYPAGAFPGKVDMIFPPAFAVEFDLPGAGNPNREARLVIKDISKFDPLRASLPVKMEPGKWMRVLIEIRGEKVAVQLSDGQTLQATCADAGAPKKTPYFYAMERLGCAVDYDNLKLWEIE
jgi:hypothetical protein